MTIIAFEDGTFVSNSIIAQEVITEIIREPYY